MHARAVTVVIALVSMLALAACSASGGGAGSPGAASADGGVTASGAWVRAAQAGGTSAGYLVLANGGATDDELVGVSATDITDDASLHETTADGSGMTGMQHTDSVKVPAGGSVALEPGGYHIMLMDLKRELKAGEQVTLVLTLEGAGVVSVTAEVRSQ